jgi:hypothetical protein
MALIVAASGRTRSPLRSPSFTIRPCGAPGGCYVRKRKDQKDRADSHRTSIAPNRARTRAVLKLYRTYPFWDKTVHTPNGRRIQHFAGFFRKEMTNFPPFHRSFWSSSTVGGSVFGSNRRLGGALSQRSGTRRFSMRLAEQLAT